MDSGGQTLHELGSLESTGSAVFNAHLGYLKADFGQFAPGQSGPEKVPSEKKPILLFYLVVTCRL